MTPDENTALGRAPGSIDRPPLCAGARAGCGHLLPGQTVHMEERTDSCGWCKKGRAAIAEAVAAETERCVQAAKQMGWAGDALRQRRDA